MRSNDQTTDREMNCRQQLAPIELRTPGCYGRIGLINTARRRLFHNIAQTLSATPHRSIAMVYSENQVDSVSRTTGGSYWKSYFGEILLSIASFVSQVKSTPRFSVTGSGRMSIAQKMEE